MNKKSVLEYHDQFRLILRDNAEAGGLYGPDYIEDIGLEIPEELVERYKQNDKEFRSIQDELKKYFKG